MKKTQLLLGAIAIFMTVATVAAQNTLQGETQITLSAETAAATQESVPTKSDTAQVNAKPKLQRKTFTAHITDNAGKPIKGANIYVKKTTTDEQGRCVLNARYGRQIVVYKKDYKALQIKLLCDSTRRVTLNPKSGDLSGKIVPKPLQKKFESPIYVVNGKCNGDFNPQNYTTKEITSIKTSNKWNKFTEQLFSGTSFEKIDIQKRGVVYLTLDESIKLFQPKQTHDYNIIVTDHRGEPLKGATVYIQRGRSDENGVSKFKSASTVGAFICGPNKYADHRMRLPDTTEFRVKLHPVKRGENSTNKPTLPKFQGGTLNDFRWWVSNALRPIHHRLQRDFTTEAIASFVIGVSGKVTSVTIIKSNDAELAREVKQVIYNSPAWTPGTQYGKKMRVKFTIPIRISGAEDM